MMTFRCQDWPCGLAPVRDRERASKCVREDTEENASGLH